MSTNMLEKYLKSKNDGGSFKDVKWKYVFPHLPNVSEKEKLYFLGIEKKEQQDLEVVKHLNSLTEDIQQYLIKALKYGYKWVSEDLSNFILCNVKAALKLQASSVPFSPAYEMERHEEVQNLRNLLIHASKQGGRFWIVVYGMMGSGKSTLAAQALRDPTISLETFKGDICWLGMGQKDVADDGYLLKVQGLCEQLNRSFSPGNWESCKNFLRRYFVDHPKGLLILDDVHSSDIIKNFDLGVTVLVTTRNLTVMPNSLADRVEAFKLDTGFTSDQSKTLFSSFLKIPVNELPEEAGFIHDKYRGSPLVMALVSGHLLRFNKVSHKHWKDLWTKFQSRKIGPTNNSADRNLREAVELLVDSLTSDLRSKLMDFALFWEDFFVPQKVFELLWDMSDIDTEEVLVCMENYCLIRRREEDAVPQSLNSSEEDDKCYCFSVHDLLFDYLKFSDRPNKVQHHTTLVEKYIAQCRRADGQYDYRLLPRDGYIHMFLGYHLSRSSRHDLFPEIFFDLQFLQMKIEISGVFDVLNDFRIYSRYFGEKHHLIEDFKRFLCQNGRQLYSSNEKEDGTVVFDLIQLALMEPKSTPVYKQALKAIALLQSGSKTHKSYYSWCNESNIRDSLILSLRPHFPKKTFWAVFSPDGKLVASCGKNKMLKLWDCNNGKEMEQFQEHESAVTSCCFSPCGKLILSASASGELKLWEVPDSQHFFGNGFSQTWESGDRPMDCPVTPRPRTGSFTFNQSHSPSPFKSSQAAPRCNLEKNNGEWVTACAFSKTTRQDDLLAASGYENGKIKIWQVRSESLVKTLSGHTQEVTCLSFSPKGALASSSKDLKIILWDLNSGTTVRELQHSDYVVFSCQFNKAGDYLLSSAGKYAWLWDLRENSSCEPRKFNGLNSTCHVKHCVFSPDETIIAGGTTSGSVILWSVSSGSIICALPGHSDPVTCVYFSKDGSKLLSTSHDCGVNMWAVNGKGGNQISLHSVGHDISFSKHLDVKFFTDDSNVSPLIAVSELNQVQVLRNVEGQHLCKIDANETVSSCCLSPDGKVLVYTTHTGYITVESLFPSNKDSSSVLGSHSLNSKVTGCHFSSCGHWFMTFLEGGNILLWDVKSVSSSQSVALKGHTSDIIGCRMFTTPNMESGMLSWASDGKLMVWVLNEAKCLLVVSHGDENVTCGDIHTDRNILVSGSVDTTVRVWNSNTGENLVTFELKTCVRSCCLSRNADRLAVGEDNGCITIFDMEKRQRCYELKRHKDFVYDLHFSEDSKMLVSAGDGLCWWWLPRHDDKNQLLQTFSFLGGKIQTVFASPDFSVFVAVDSNGILFILKKICLNS